MIENKGERYRTYEDAVEMLDSIKADPAFPMKRSIQYNNGKNQVDIHHFGLQKREYFAGLFMQGMINAQLTRQGALDMLETAKWAVEAADSLMKKLDIYEGSNEAKAGEQKASEEEHDSRED